MEDPRSSGPSAGSFYPRIDTARCEGKEACLQVCPTGVFVIRRLTPAEKSTRPLGTRLKLWVHGGRQAFAEHAEVCSGCGLCVQACPERAIVLVRKSG